MDGRGQRPPLKYMLLLARNRLWVLLVYPSKRGFLRTHCMHASAEFSSFPAFCRQKYLPEDKLVDTLGGSFFVFGTHHGRNGFGFLLQLIVQLFSVLLGECWK